MNEEANLFWSLHTQSREDSYVGLDMFLLEVLAPFYANALDIQMKSGLKILRILCLTTWYLLRFALSEIPFTGDYVFLIRRPYHAELVDALRMLCFFIFNIVVGSNIYLIFSRNV